MSSVLRKMMIVVGANISDFVTGMDKVDKKLLAQSRQFERMGKDLTVGLTLPLMAVGVAAIKAAAEYEAASAIIRRQTGATGQDLVGLNQSFRNLFTTVPATSRETAEALATLQTRTGQTGKALEDLTRQHLNLARISGEAVKPMIEQTTRVFGDWSVATSQQGAALDYMYKVSQQTGIGVSRLGQLMVQYGAPLRQMGFDYETAAAMMGKFEQEGVNVELVMGSLRIALGKMAKDGVQDTTAALREVTKQIREAGTVGAANAIALEVFGARAGPDMAAAIREGRFDLDELLAKLKASPDTINGVSKETLTLGERFALLRNRAIDAAQPLGNVLLKAAQGLMPVLEGLGDISDGVGQAFAALPAPVRDFGIGLGVALASIGPMIVGVAKLQQAIINLKTALNYLSAHPLMALAVGIIAVGTAFAQMNQRMQESINARAAEIEKRITAQVAEEKRLALEGVAAEEQASQAKIKAASAATRAKLENLDKEKEKHRETLQERKRLLDEEHRAVIDKIREEYGYVQDASNSKTDVARRASQAVIDGLDAELRKATEVYNERMRQIAEQYDAQIRLLDAETREALAAVQEQISAIDEQTKTEERALRQQADQRRVAELQARIAAEEDVARRTELQQQLADLLADIERRQLLDSREEQKNALRDQMDAIRADAEDRKAKLQEQRKEKEEHEKELLKLETDRINDAKKAEQERLDEVIKKLQEERKAKEALENDKYKAAKKSIDDQLKGLDDYFLDYKAKLEREVKEKEAAEAAKLKATLDRLADERKAIEAHYKEIEDSANIAKRALEAARAEFDAATERAAATSKWYAEQGTLPGDVSPPPSALPKFAAGGVVRRPMIAQIGEVPEAVTPLDWLGDQLERAAAQIGAAMASMMYAPPAASPAFAGAGFAAGSSGPASINLTVEVEGREIVRAIGVPLAEEIRMRTGYRGG